LIDELFSTVCCTHYDPPAFSLPHRFAQTRSPYTSSTSSSPSFNRVSTRPYKRTLQRTSSRVEYQMMDPSFRVSAMTSFGRSYAGCPSGSSGAFYILHAGMQMVLRSSTGSRLRGRHWSPFSAPPARSSMCPSTGRFSSCTSLRCSSSPCAGKFSAYIFFLNYFHFFAVFLNDHAASYSPSLHPSCNPLSSFQLFTGT
jgi:hypothetical protein